MNMVPICKGLHSSWVSFHRTSEAVLSLHDHAATLERPEELRQAFLDQLLHLVVLVLVLVLVLLLVTTAMLPTVLLLLATTMVRLLVTTVALSSMLGGVSTISRCLRWRRHSLNGSTLQVHIDPTLIFFRRILQSEFATHLFNSWLDLLNMIPRVISFADNHVKMRLALAAGNLDALL